MILTIEQTGQLKKDLKLLCSVLKGDVHVIVDQERGLLHGLDSDLALAVDAPYLKVNKPIVTVADPVGTGAKFRVEAKKFHSVLTHLKGDVGLQLQDNVLHLTATKASFDLPTSPAQAPPFKDFRPVTTLLAKLLSGILEQACTVADNKQYASVLVTPSATSLRAVATDGGRLIVAEGLYEGGQTLSPLLISERAASAICQLPGEKFYLSTDESSLTVDTGKVRLVARRTSAKFPEWEKVVPTKVKSEYRVKTEDMLESLERIDSVVDQKDASVFMICCEDKIMLVLNKTYGVATDEVSATGKSMAEDFDPDFDSVQDSVHLRLSFLQSFFNLVKTGEVVVQITDDRQPVCFESGPLKFIIAPLAGTGGIN